MDAWPLQYWHLAWMVPTLFVAVYLGSPRYTGRIAQQRVERLLRHSLDPDRYRQFHRITIRGHDGGMDIDHLLVSSSGVTLIVSEYRPGAVSGGEAQFKWKQKRFGRTRPWPNPVHRGKAQIELIEELTGIPRNRIELLVAVVGQDQLTGNLPHQLVSANRLLDRIRSRSQPLFSAEQVEKAARAISECAVPPARGFGPVGMIRLLLVLAVLIGAWFAYGAQLSSFFGNFDEGVEQLAHPARFDERGQRKTERQILEETLMCAYSEDSGRCSCYEKAGERVEVETELCRELAERGSILQK